MNCGGSRTGPEGCQWQSLGALVPGQFEIMLLD